MKKLYHKKLKTELVNKTTGEVTTAITKVIEPTGKYPIRGYRGVYMRRLEDLVELSKMAQRLFFKLSDKENIDTYNIVKVRWNKLAEQLGTSKVAISKAKRELEEADFINKYNKKYMVNPFLVLPIQDRDDEENKWRTQQIWKHLFEDKDKGWYQGIEEDIEFIFE